MTIYGIKCFTIDKSALTLTHSARDLHEISIKSVSVTIIDYIIDSIYNQKRSTYQKIPRDCIIMQSHL